MTPRDQAQHPNLVNLSQLNEPVEQQLANPFISMILVNDERLQLSKTTMDPMGYIQGSRHHNLIASSFSHQ